jgi:glycosyltransferase involved in cell wall biosynthesis
MSDVGCILKEADALLVHLKKDPLFTITIPSKTQAYMAVGKPILMALDGDAADLVRDCGCGLFAVSENPESIAAAALALHESDATKINEMASKGRRYYREKLSIKVGVKRFALIFNKLGNDGDDLRGL